MMRPFHNWTSVRVPQNEVHVSPHHNLVFSHQCGRCGLLRHTVSASHTAGSAITYELVSEFGPVRTWWWHYPDGRRWCKPKDWQGRAA